MKDLIKIFKGEIQEKEPKIKTFVFTDESQKDRLKAGFVNLAKNLCSDFEINKNNRDVIAILYAYFLGQPEFIELLKNYNGADGSFNKGILLMGGVGVGKSLIMRIFKDLTMTLSLNGFRYADSITIIDNAAKNGADALYEYGVVIQGRAIRTSAQLYIDDIASKNENVKYFGTDFNVIEHLLTIRYNCFIELGALTHATTNKYPKELVECYDLRVVDRMKEMFNIIELPGESFRK